jgi:hypothetical protein
MPDVTGRIPINDDKQSPLAAVEWTGTLRKGLARVVVPTSVPQSMRAEVTARVQSVIDMDAGQPKDRFVTIGENYLVPGRGTFAGLVETFLKYADGFGLYVVGCSLEWPEDPDGPRTTDAFLAAMNEMATEPVAEEPLEVTIEVEAARRAWWDEHGGQT